MARIVCDYCGTEYDDTMQRCPLCGSVNDMLAQPEPEEEPPVVVRRERSERPERRQDSAERRGGSRAAERREPAPGRRRSNTRRRTEENSDRIPRWLSVLICVVLGIAVVIGALYALYAIGVFSPSTNTDGGDASLTLPIEGDDTTGGSTDGTGDAQSGDSGQSDSATPDEVLCTGLTVSPASVRMQSAGISTVVSATVEPADCTEPVTWTSSDPSICTVDEQGVITAVDGGTATVTAACGSFQAEVTVNCDFSNSQENNAYLSLTDFTLFSAGDQATIQVLDAPDGATVTWSSSNTGVCTVSNGEVTAVGSGTATVTATVNDKQLTCTVRCSFVGSSEPNDSNAEVGGGGYQLDHTDVTLGVGESFEISVVDGISGGWNVSDASVITVDANGIVTALASGTATVYTTVGGQRLECIVRVP